MTNDEECGAVVVMSVVAVVGAKRDDLYLIANHAIDETVFIVDAAGPASREVVLEWLGLASSGEWIPPHVIE